MDELGRGAPFQKLRHTPVSPARSRRIGLRSTARARTEPRLADRHRAEQGLDDPLPAIVKRTRQTTMTASAIQGGALLDLAVDHSKLKLLLDEAVRRSPVGEGFIERGHFFDSAASMWVAGELVHIEDLVLHDAHMDVRVPTHELTIGYSLLRTRHRVAAAEPAWALSDRGLFASSGPPLEELPAEEPQVGHRAGDMDLAEDIDPLATEFAQIDALLERSERLISSMGGGNGAGVPERRGLVVGDLMIRDPECDEADRLSQWRSIQEEVQGLPPVLGAALLFDAWEVLEPIRGVGAHPAAAGPWWRCDCGLSSLQGQGNLAPSGLPFGLEGRW